MRQRLESPRVSRCGLRLAAAVTAAGLVAASCGSDGGSDGGSASSAEDFCAEVAALEDEESEDDDLNPEDVELLRDLTTRASAEIRGALETMTDGMEAALELDEEDLEGFFEIFLSPDMVAASEALETFSVEECGLEPSIDDDSVSISESGDLDEVEPVEGDTDGDAFVPDLSGVDDPLYDDFFDDPIDPDVASLDGLKAHFDLEYTDAEWRTQLSSFGYSGDEWSVGGTELGAAAVEVCEATAAYLVAYEPDATIVITEVEFEPDYSETPIANGDAAGNCAAG